jgi:hypothetical protein
VSTSPGYGFVGHEDCTIDDPYRCRGAPLATIMGQRADVQMSKDWAFVAQS